MQHNGERLVVFPIMTTEATEGSTLDMSLGDQENGVSVKESLDKVDEQLIPKGNTCKDNLVHDKVDIVVFCVHDIGISES